jgi:hypothetical protein
MPVEQKYVNGQQSKMYARRVKVRKRMDGEYLYPFGLLSIVDLMDRILNVKGVKTKRRPSRQIRSAT